MSAPPPVAPPLCKHCGGPNPPGTRSCQWCHATLPLESSGYRSLAPIVPPEVPKTPPPWILVGIALMAIFLLLFFVFLVLYGP
jgi:hypothetical protein